MSANPSLFGSATCWLEVRLRGRACLFEFSPQCDTAVVVGSVEGAEIAIDIPGTPPVAFHFEREGDAIVVVPGYHSQPRVNAVVATGPVAVGSHARIELKDVALEAWLHWEKPSHLQLSLRGNLMADRSSYHANLPADDQTTSLAFEPFTHGLQQHTEVMRPVRFDPEPLDSSGQPAGRVERTERFVVPVVHTEALPVLTGALCTEVMAPVRFAPEPVVARRVEKTPVMETPSAYPGLPTARVAPAACAAAAPVAPVPIIALAGTTSPDPAPFLPTPEPGVQLTTTFDLAALSATAVDQLGPAESESRPPASSPATPPSQAGRPSERSVVRRAATAASRGIALLGSHTKRRPVAVLTGAAATTAVAVFAQLGVAHLFAAGPEVNHSVARTHSSPVASAPPLAPSVATPFAAATPQAPQSAMPLPLAAAAPIASQTAPGRKARSPSATQTAVRHLAGGRYDEAERAYAALATDHPEASAYRVIVTLLRARTKARCGGPSSAPSCPEVRP